MADKPALILHPIDAVGRTSLYNMVLFALSVIVGGIFLASPRIRHFMPFGSFTRSGIAREDLPVARECAEQSRTTPVKQFLVVVLPDGKIVTPKLAERM
jgi:hypothetical protein